MKDRPLLAVASALGLGCATGGGVGTTGAAVLLGLALVAVAAALRARAAPAGLLAAAVAIGAAASAGERVRYDAAPLRRLALEHEKEPVRLRGVLRGDPRPTDGGTQIVVDVVGASRDGRAVEAAGRARIQVSADEARLALRDGDAVALWATLSVPRRFRTPGAYDSEAQARRDGVHATGWCKSAALVERLGPGGDWLTVSASRARAWTRGRLVAAVPAGDELAVLRAMLLGDRSTLSPDAGDAFRRAGTYHVLAISGAQVAIVVALLAWIGRRSGVAPWIVAGGVTGATLFYAALVGGDIPVVRAAIAAVLIVWGRALDLDSDLANLLGLAAAVLLVWSPSAISDVGFQLSFAATLAIVSWTSAIAARLPRLAFRLEVALASSIAAQAALLPLLLLHFHRASPAGIVLNLVAVPLSGLTLLAAAGVALVPPLPAVAAPVAGCAWWVAHLLLASSDPMGLASRIDARFPDPPLVAILLFTGSLVALGRGCRRAAPLAGGAALALFAAAQPASDGRLEISLLDVGQGDAVVIRTPGGGHVMVDAGGGRSMRFDMGEAVVAPFLWSQGVRQLDAAVVSHAHPDHSGGIPAVARAFGPRAVWEGTAPASDPGYDRFDGALRPLGLIRRSVRCGSRASWDGIDVEVLGPCATRRPWTVKNDESVVLLLRFGAVRIVLAGDIEAAGEARIAGTAADIVKVAHHGSRTSSTERFVAGTRARLALVSAGQGNTFGHPHPEVTRRWSGSGAAVLRTDLEGTLTVSTDGFRIWTRTFADPRERRVR